MLVVVSTFCGSIEVLACTATYGGNTFLNQARIRGITTRSDCHENDLAKNSFYAPPNQPCSVRFVTDEWLGSGWTFRGIEGAGRFTSKIQTEEGESALVVTIKRAGGFRLKSITLSRDKGDCASVSWDEIFRK